MVGNPGVEPGVSWSQARRVAVSLAPGGEGRNRTGSTTLAGRVRYLTCHPHAWTAPDLNREPPPCRGGALPVGASSPGPPRPETPEEQGGGRGGTKLILFGLCQPSETLRPVPKE